MGNSIWLKAVGTSLISDVVNEKKKRRKKKGTLDLDRVKAFHSIFTMLPNCVVFPP